MWPKCGIGVIGHEKHKKAQKENRAIVFFAWFFVSYCAFCGHQKS
jgi:hypothetical protein